jgi:hypothetical protein
MNTITRRWMRELGRGTGGEMGAVTGAVRMVRRVVARYAVDGAVGQALDEMVADLPELTRTGGSAGTTPSAPKGRCRSVTFL